MVSHIGTHYQEYSIRYTIHILRYPDYLAVGLQFTVYTLGTRSTKA